MKAVVRKVFSYFTTFYVTRLVSNGTNVTEIHGLEFELLLLVLKQMNMTFIHVPTPAGFEFENRLTDNLTSAMLAKEVYIALGGMGRTYLMEPSLDFSQPYYTTGFGWYVQCSIKYPRWSSLFRILSVELWLVLFISIAIAAISTTLVGRYSYTPECQVYKTLSSSLTSIWAVILGVSVSTMPRTPSLRSLFLAWVCFSLAFSTVFQSILTTFLIDSGYKKPIQNKDELYESGNTLYYLPGYYFVFENGDETEVSKVQRNRANCPSVLTCIDWARNHKDASVLSASIDIELYYALGRMLAENSEPLLCRLEGGEVYYDGLRMAMLQGDPLLDRVTEIIDRVVEAGIYDYLFSLGMNGIKVESRKISLVPPLDGFYSFNLYHMQPAFYLLLMGWCLSAFCFMFEFVYNRFLNLRRYVVTYF
jgi:hypothetical protein